jgi:uncharacterized protein (TIGR00251 family)
MPADEIFLEVRASTRSSRSEIQGFVEGQLRIKVTAAPVDGKANAEIIRLLAGEFRAPRSQISLVRGVTSSVKLFRICGARRRPEYCRKTPQPVAGSR